MSWSFDDIDFASFGVMVSKSSGVLDLPKLKTDGFDWLDSDGRDYWQSVPKYDNREIVLNCWMMAEATRNIFGEVTVTGYVNFMYKVKLFTDAIKSKGKCSFVTPYITISNCTIESGVSVIRETNYVQDIQAGTFTLRIKVHGDSSYDLVSILDQSGSTPIDIIKTNNLTVYKTLQGDWYVTCTTETNEPLLSNMYEYINVKTNGIDNEKYYLPSNPEFKKLATNKYQYNLRFAGATEYLKQIKFLFNGQAEFDIYADLETIIDLIITNLDRWTWITDKFNKGTIAATVKKNHTFSNENCLDVLRRIVSEYEMEYYFELIPVVVHYNIHVSEQIGNTKSVTLEYGKGNGLYEITRRQADTSKICTVLYAFGAAKNLKPTYRSGLKRLSFTANPLIQNDTVYGRFEEVKNFDEIYPNRTSSVTGYLQVLPEDLTAAEKEVYPQGIYIIGDSTLDFDLNDYLIGGLTAKIRMKTGNLAGYEFDILRYDNSNKYIHIIRFQDEQGGLLPNATLQIEAGDEYTLVDIDQPTSYVTAAEAELEAAAQEYIDLWSTPLYSYAVKINPAFMLANPTLGFDVGDKITVSDSDFGINGLFRITELVYNKNTGIFDLVLSDFRKMSKRQKLEFRVKEIERALLITNKTTTEVIRDEHKTVGELERKLLDPLGKLNVDKIVENNSLDPRHISLDTGIPMFFIENARVETDVDDDYQKARIEAGKISISNDPAKVLDRFEIKKKKDNSEVYNPVRSWTIPATDLTMTTDNMHFVYAKLNLATGSTACEIFLNESHIEPKAQIDDGFIIYKIGSIPAAQEV